MEIKPANLFSDHMVIQQGVPVPVWGWSVPGDEITVQFLPSAGSPNRKQKVKTEADKEGKWLTKIYPLVACAKPARVVFKSSLTRKSVEITDVLVGEVWLASGQSNMEWQVKDSLNAQTEIASANFPSIRMFTVPKVVKEKPPVDVEGNWSICSPRTVDKFSAVAYFFGRELYNNLQVPVGLINSSWGGTRIETWISRDALMSDPLCAEEVRGYEAALASMQTEEWELQMEQYRKDPAGWLRTHVVQDPGNKGYGLGWAKLEFDDSQWQEMELPQPWQRGGVAGNGVVWFRRIIEIPDEWVGHEIVLHLGACDKHDITYFNNVQVGVTGWETPSPWTALRVYRIPPLLVQKGRNVIAVRIYSYRNLGGIVGPREEMYLECPAVDKRRISLCGKWHYMVEHNFGVIRGNAGEPPQLPNQNSPYALFNSMIAPLIPYAIRGVIWYQGESNTDMPHLYRKRFPMLIQNWRNVWAKPDLPFLFVQLANYEPVLSSGKNGWAELREAQFLALKEPNTAMVVAIDIGDPIDVHPRNKQEVGKRLARCAEALVYGRDVVYSGPLYKSHAVEGDSIRISFSHIGTGLMSKGDKLKGFVISGVDKRFVPAEAVIENDTVVVRSPEVKSPVAVRYGWAANPECNLYNKEGLPASPFRTDNWNEST
jgi:sialate O-acetylesterase